MLKNTFAVTAKQSLAHQTFMNVKEIKNNMREYGKYEFCKAMKCPALKDNLCLTDPEVCVFSAKEFHIWLKENNFKLVKDNNHDIPA